MPDVTIVHVDQGTPEWFAARAGRLTGSCARAMMSKGRKKGEESVGRSDLRLRLVCERLSGRSLDDGGYESFWMRRGKERESFAIAAYEAATGRLVDPVGFVKDNARQLGFSPDGVVGRSRLLEVKCPKPSTHLRYIQSGGIPSEYVPQVTHGLLLTGAEHVDFVSYAEEFPAELQLYVYTSHRNRLDISGYERSALAFLAEVAEEEQAVRALIKQRSVGDGSE